tara:strand:- start:646 stop:1227 length:582 start_codon:yes stop_codon:yes gene_type:complete
MISDFIGVYPDVVPEKLCDYLIKFFDQSNFSIIKSRSTENRSPWRSDKQIIMESFAPGEATDLLSFVSKALSDYVNELAPIFHNFSFVSSLTLLQKTEPKQGYHNFHAEDTAYQQSDRTMAWMVYLNDVENGGETEFLHQQKKIKPEKGTVVIWPGGFTHMHRGNPPMSNKYIATGWFQVDAGSLNERTFKLK